MSLLCTGSWSSGGWTSALWESASREHLATFCFGGLARLHGELPSCRQSRKTVPHASQMHWPLSQEVLGRGRGRRTRRSWAWLPSLSGTWAVSPGVRVPARNNKKLTSTAPKGFRQACRGCRVRPWSYSSTWNVPARSGSSSTSCRRVTAPWSAPVNTSYRSWARGPWACPHTAALARLAPPRPPSSSCGCTGVFPHLVCLVMRAVLFTCETGTLFRIHNSVF